MLCLGIETSCDETALALSQQSSLIAQKLRSQQQQHAIYGGVVPEIASREHLQALPDLLDQLRAEGNVSFADLDLVAVTRGPGLMGSLLVGLGLAKGLVQSTGTALVGVNHLQAHLIAPEMEQEVVYPALGLLVSGGHTQLYYMRSNVDMELLGRSLDDAAGEAFDKTAKLLNLPYPGGKHIDRLAAMAEPDTAMFPRPYLDNDNLDFSFSGLKTAVANYLRKNPGLRLSEMDSEPVAEEIFASRPGLAKLCSSFTWSICQAIKIKLQRAVRRYPGAYSLLLAGGVAANSAIRRVLHEVAEENNLRLVLPSSRLCTDNAAMVAYTGEVIYGLGWHHQLNVEAIPRGKSIPWDYSPLGVS